MVNDIETAMALGKSMTKCSGKVMHLTPDKIMAKTPHQTKPFTPNKAMAEAPAKTNPKFFNKPPGTLWCIFCRKDFLKRDAHDHIQSMLHHRELESVLGRDCIHYCQLCKASILGLGEYAKHITTANHKANMKKMSFRRVILPEVSLSKKLVQELRYRNKELKKIEHKTKKKRQKKQKLQRKLKSMMEKSIQSKEREKPNTQAQLLNKENRLAGSHHPGQSTVQQACGGLNLQSGELSGDGWERHSEHLETSQRGPREVSSAQVSTLNGGNSNVAGSIGSADVGLLLCEIRKALGVMEPCRAERAACSEVPNQEAEVQGEAPGSSEQFTSEKQGPNSDGDKQSPFCSGGEVGKSLTSSTLQSQHVSTSISTLASGVQSSEHSTTRTQKEKKRALKKEITYDAALRIDNGSESDGPTTKDQSTQGVSAYLTQHLGRTATHDPNLNVARSGHGVIELWKVKPEKETGFKPNLKKHKVESQEKVNRKERVKGLSRFGIELSNHEDSHEGDEEHPLSEGFQWELAFPDGPSPAPVSSPSLHQDVVANALPTKGNADATVHGTGSPSMALQDKGPSQAGAMARVKMEAYSEVQQVNVKQTKRKRKADGESEDISNVSPGGNKKQNTKKDQVQVDQLLAVSLKEEELSRSLQEVDIFLIQARNALQAAYTEVQRLLLLKQQVSTEVNSLRTKRIEILQGMQDGFSATSSLGEKDCTVPTPSAQANIPVKLEPSRHSQNSLRNTYSPLVATDSLLMPSVASPKPNSQVLHPFSMGTSISPVLLPTLLPTPSALPATTALPAMASPSMQRAESSMLAAVPLPRPTAQNLTIQTRMKNARERYQSSDSDSEEALKGVGHPGTAQTKGSVVTTSAPDQHTSGADSDSSLEMMELTPGSGAIVAVDSDSSSDSDSEDTSEDDHLVKNAASQASVQLASSQNIYSKNKNSSGPHTSLVKLKEDNAQRKIEVPTVAEGTEDELGSFQAHTGPIHGLQVHGDLLYTCSGDNTARAYSLKSKECRAVFEGHTSKVNCLLVSCLPGLPARLFTGSSDKTIRCYSIKTNKCLEQISLPERVFCMHIDWLILYVGLANGTVFSFNLKTQKQLNIFECHVPRGVSCLGTSQEGARRVLLVGSYDSTISVRDAKSGLLLRTLQGHTKTVLCMKVVNDLVFSGSSDTSVHANNIHTGELVRIYKGHGQAVTSLAILGKVMVTSCLDKLVRVYELQSHDRLQVYGGHNEMVMCMTINNSVIYTGCYDGSIQAVKLNLMKNYRCWWHGCSLIFGIAEHLQQHLLSLHCSPTQQTLMCRWRNCDAFFSKPDTIRLDFPGHVQSHVEADSRLET